MEIVDNRIKIVRDESESYYIDQDVWEENCLKFNHPLNEMPTFLGHGIEWAVFTFGEKYVLKLSYSASSYHHALRVKDLNSRFVLEPLSVFFATTEKQVSCCIQERCDPHGVHWDEVNAPVNKFINHLEMISRMLGKVRNAEPITEVELDAKPLAVAGVKYISDLHTQNVMIRKNGDFVVSDLGCIVFYPLAVSRKHLYSSQC